MVAKCMLVDDGILGPGARHMGLYYGLISQLYQQRAGSAALAQM